jgi:hypothetical protein
MRMFAYTTTTRPLQRSFVDSRLIILSTTTITTTLLIATIMEREAVRPIHPLPISPRSFKEVEADAVSIVSSLESLPPPPEPFPLDELMRQRQISSTTDDDAISDTATVQYDVSVVVYFNGRMTTC